MLSKIIPWQWVFCSWTHLLMNIHKLQHHTKNPCYQPELPSLKKQEGWKECRSWPSSPCWESVTLLLSLGWCCRGVVEVEVSYPLVGDWVSRVSSLLCAQHSLCVQVQTLELLDELGLVRGMFHTLCIKNLQLLLVLPVRTCTHKHSIYMYTPIHKYTLSKITVVRQLIWISFIDEFISWMCKKKKKDKYTGIIQHTAFTVHSPQLNHMVIPLC